MLRNRNRRDYDAPQRHPDHPRPVTRRDFLAQGLVDAVYIAVPNHLHCDYTVRAARQGGIVGTRAGGRRLTSRFPRLPTLAWFAPAVSFCAGR